MPRSVTTPSRALLLLALAVLLGSTPALAQHTGAIAGTLVDAENGETLIGANVIVAGTATGASTDIDGRYSIRGLEPGRYDLELTYIGYTPARITGVEVAAGETTRIDFALSTDAVLMEDIVVEARAIRNSDAVLLKDRQKAAAVSDAISAEAISRSGASDAAGAMSKVTGASVVGGTYVYVRGLGDRYSATQMNGVRLPSSDPDKNAVPLDLLPTDLLDNIVTLKTFTPDKPGSFSGGLVDIGTKTFPDTRSARLSVSTSLNSQAHLGGDRFILYDGGRNWLGFGDGTRGVPAALAGDVEIPAYPGNAGEGRGARFNANEAARLAELSRAFDDVMAPQTATAPLNQSYALSYGNKLELGGMPLGIIGSATYTRSASYREGTTGRYGVGSDAAAELDPQLLVSDVQGTSAAAWGGLANVALRPAERHEVGLNVFYTAGTDVSSRYQEGLYPEIGDETFLQNRVLGFKERNLLSTQLRGTHAVGPFSAQWSASLARTEQDEPDLRFFGNTVRYTETDTLYAASGSGIDEPSRYFRNLQEDARDAKLDVTLPFETTAGRQARLKFGGAYSTTDRRFRERLFQIYTDTGNASRYGMTFAGDPGVYFSDLFMGVVDTVSSRRGGRTYYEFINYVQETSKPRNNYDGEQRVGAGYAMVDLPLTGRLRFVGGVRVETTDLRVESRDSTQAAGTLDDLDWLPSLNLVYSLVENMNLRAAATRTLARPTFREVAPFESFDFLLGAFHIGNPELERTLITNVDLRWEWFVNPGEILAVSGFYKGFRNPIELTLVGGTNGQRKYQNVDAARVVGLELEARKGLGSIARPLQFFSLGGNASFVVSEINIAENELAIRRAIDPEAGDTRALQGQSPYIVNLDLSYANPGSGTTAALLYNVFGARLSGVSLGATPDVYERPRPVLDFTFAQTLLGGLRMKAKASNLLGSTYRETYRYRGQDFTYYEYDTGRTFSLGFSYGL